MVAAAPRRYRVSIAPIGRIRYAACNTYWAVETQTRSISSRSLRILVVDDEPRVSETLALVLRREGHQVACVPSGRAAVDRIERGRPVDMVLTDLGMPDVSGWAVARLVKQHWPEVPVGLVTGWGDDEALGSAADRATVDFILAKPIDRRSLSETLARWTRSLAA
jgi:CheY-like chemotaxis protein